MFTCKWNDQFGASGNDYDLFICPAGLKPIKFNFQNDLCAGSDTQQDGNDDPDEAAFLFHPGEADIFIRKYSSDARRLEMFISGASDAALRDNIISGNVSHGVSLSGSGTANADILGDKIGVSASASGGLSNTGSAVHVSGWQNVAIYRNIIGSSGSHGVSLTGSSTYDIHIVENYIGTNEGGTALGNNCSGVHIASSSHGNSVEANTVANNTDDDGVTVTATYTVELDSDPGDGAIVTVNIELETLGSIKTGITLMPETIYFTVGTNGNWGTPQPVTISGLPDDDEFGDLAEIDHSITVGNKTIASESVLVTVTEGNRAPSNWRSRTAETTSANGSGRRASSTALAVRWTTQP